METILILALLTAISMAIFAASRMLIGGIATLRAGRPIERRPFPIAMSHQSHWDRASKIVELSLTRAADLATHHANAARQLEAADYALHVLLGDLGPVMATTVSSPLLHRVRPAETSVRMPSAMAA